MQAVLIHFASGALKMATPWPDFNQDKDVFLENEFFLGCGREGLL
jgi:hypothetical protein